LYSPARIAPAAARGSRTVRTGIPLLVAAVTSWCPIARPDPRLVRIASVHAMAKGAK
jgi:hypothetical protein